MFKDGLGAFEVCGLFEQHPTISKLQINVPKENKVSASDSQGDFPALPGFAGPGRKFQRQGVSAETPAVRFFCWVGNAPLKEQQQLGKAWNKE